jgi:hypothetical protein
MRDFDHIELRYRDAVRAIQRETVEELHENPRNFVGDKVHLGTDRFINGIGHLQSTAFVPRNAIVVPSARAGMAEPLKPLYTEGELLQAFGRPSFSTATHRFYADKHFGRELRGQIAFELKPGMSAYVPVYANSGKPVYSTHHGSIHVNSGLRKTSNELALPTRPLSMEPMSAPLTPREIMPFETQPRPLKFVY